MSLIPVGPGPLALPPPAKVEKESWASWISRRIVGEEEIEVDLTQITAVQIPGNWDRVIEKFSDSIFDSITDLVPSMVKDILIGRQDKVKPAILHMTKQIFNNLATKNNPNLILPESYGVNFILNLLKMLKFHLKDPADPNRFKNFARELLETTFPGKEKDVNLPLLGQQFLQGKGFGGRGRINWLIKKSTGYDLEAINWEFLIDKFADFAEDFNTKYVANQPVLEQKAKEFEGVTEFSEKIAKQLVAKIKTVDEIPVVLGFFAEDSDLIKNVLRKILAKKKEIDSDTESSASEDVTEEDLIIKDSWSWIERTVTNAISKVLIAILNPAAGQTITDRYHEFVNTLIENAKIQIPLWDKENQAIEKLTHADLLKIIGNIPELNEFLKYKDTLYWDERAKNHVKTIKYKLHAKALLKSELSRVKLDLLLPKFLPEDKVLGYIYDSVGISLREFHEHYHYIRKESDAAEVTLQAWKIPGMDKLLGTALGKLVSVVEEKAKKRELLLTEETKVVVDPNDKGKEEADDNDEPEAKVQYGFINEMLCYLIDPSGVQQGDGKSLFKSETFAFLKDLIKIISVRRIQKEIAVNPNMTPQAALKQIVEKILQDARGVKDLLVSTSVQEMEDKYLILDAKLILETNPVQKAKFELELTAISKELKIFHKLNKQLDEDITISKLLERKLKPKETELLERILQSKSREVFSDIISQDEYEELIPKSFRVFELNHVASDNLIYPHMKDIIAASYNEIPLNVPELTPVMDKIFPVLKGLILNVRTENEELNPFLDSVLSKDGGVSAFIDISLRTILNSVIAYHINPREGLTSEKLTIEFAWGILQRIVGILDEKDEKETQGRIAELIDFIVPDPLWNRLVQKNLQGIISKELIAHKLNEEFKDLKGHFNTLEGISGELKINPNQEAGAIREVIHKLIEQVKGSDKKEGFINNVIIELLKRNDLDGKNPVKKILETALYGIFSYYVSAAQKDGDTAADKLMLKFDGVIEILKEENADLNLVSENVVSILLEDTVGKQLNKIAEGFVKPYIASVLSLKTDFKKETQEIVADLDPTLVEFLDTKLINSIQEQLVVEGKKPERMFKEISPFLDDLLKKVFSTDNPNLQNVRNEAIRMAAFILFKDLVFTGNILDKVQDIILKYKNSKDPEVAKFIVDTLITDERWNAIPENIRKIVTKETITKAIMPYVTEFRDRINDISVKSVQAEAFLNDPKFKVIKSLTDQALLSLDETLKTANFEVPPFINWFIQSISQGSPLIKDGIKSIVYIALHNLLKGPNWQQNLQVVFGNIIAAGNQPAEWVKYLLTKETRETILPPFLRPSFTDANINKWFLMDETGQTRPELPKIDVAAKVLKNDFLAFAINFVATDNVILPQGNFAELATEEVFKTFFTGPVVDLPEAKAKLKAQIEIFTNTDSRIEYLSNSFGGLPYDVNNREAIFKKNLVSRSVREVGKVIDAKPWWGPFKAFVKALAQAIVWLIMQISLKHRLYNLALNDDFWKKAIWSAVRAPSEQVVPVTPVDLQASLSQKLKAEAIVPPIMRKKVASALAGLVNGKSILDFI